MVSDGLFYGAAGLVDVETVVEFAAGQELANLGEIVGQFFSGYVYEAKFFHAGGVYDPAAIGQVEHLGKGGGVLAFVAPAGQFLCFDAQSGYEAIDEGALAYAGMAAEQGRLAGNAVLQGGEGFGV